LGLVRDRLELGAQRSLPLTQRGHPLAQLIERHEFFLIGIEKPFDAFAHARAFSLQGVLALLRRIGSTRRDQTPVEFQLY